MSKKASTFSVTILDKEYQVACPPQQQAELLLSARHLDEQMRAIRSTGKVIGLERIAVMAALNISHELLQTRNGVRGEDNADSGEAQEGAQVDGQVESQVESQGQADGGNAAGGGALDPRGMASLNAKLDQALHRLRQLEIG